MAQSVISLPCINSVAFGAKQTWTELHPRRFARCCPVVAMPLKNAEARSEKVGDLDNVAKVANAKRRYVGAVR